MEALASRPKHFVFMDSLAVRYNVVVAGNNTQQEALIDLEKLHPMETKSLIGWKTSVAKLIISTKQKCFYNFSLFPTLQPLDSPR